MMVLLVPSVMLAGILFAAHQSLRLPAWSVWPNSWPL
jgi:hypothetical protein